MKSISQGAEAKIFLNKDVIIKNRFKKGYRIAELDDKLRRQRTKKEAKLLEDLHTHGLNFVPKLLKKENSILEMEYLHGSRLRDVLNQENCISLCAEVGQKIKKLHNRGIIHGDLTTSNMILYNQRVYFIDFGLSFHSDKAEDKAVDLHVLKETLESKHCAIWEQCFEAVVKAYGDEVVLKRLKEVEKRGRYKQKGS